LVLVGAKGRSGERTRQALEELIRAYWFPLYTYLRRQGETPSQAEDLVQEFFTRLLEKKYLAQVDRAKGKFRSFLLASLKHFLSNERDKARARKRGGGIAIVPLDSLDAETRYAIEPADNMTPERLFDRRWALAVLDKVLDRLRREYVSAGKERLFEHLKDSLTLGARAVSHADLARKLGTTEGAAKVAVHRMRGRYRELLRNEIAQTVDDPGQFDEEIDYLLNCL
jgi:RNA polymerase sigma-70 factor (ECF subfamily)